MRWHALVQRKKYVFKDRLKVSLQSEVSRKKSGSEFQTIGPATENARRPKLERRWRGTMSRYIEPLLAGTGNSLSQKPKTVSTHLPLIGVTVRIPVAATTERGVIYVEQFN